MVLRHLSSSPRALHPAELGSPHPPPLGHALPQVIDGYVLYAKRLPEIPKQAKLAAEERKTEGWKVGGWLKRYKQAESHLVKESAREKKDDLVGESCLVSW